MRKTKLKTNRRIKQRHSQVLRDMVYRIVEPFHEKYTIVSKILNEELLSTIFFEIEKIERMKQARASQMVELNEFFRLAVKSLNYHAFANKHCVNDKWTLKEQEEDVPKPKIDNWARHRMGVEFQYKKIELFKTPLKEIQEVKSRKDAGKGVKGRRREKFKRMGEEDPFGVGSLKRFDTLEKFEIDGVLDTRFFKGVVELKDRGENLSESEQKIEDDMRKNKIIRDNIAKDRLRRNSNSNLKGGTKFGGFHDIKRLEEEKVVFTTDFTGNPIVVKKPKPYLLGLPKPKRALYRVEKEPISLEIAKSMLKEKYNVSTTREALMCYLGDTKGTHSTTRTASTAGGRNQSRLMSAKLDSKIIKELKADISKEEEGDGDFVESSILENFRDRRDRMRTESEIKGAIMALRQFMMKINPADDDILTAGSTIRRMSEIFSDPRAILSYSELIEQYNKIIKIGSKILKKHQIKYSYIETKPTSSPNQRESISKSRYKSRDSSIFKKSSKNYNFKESKKKQETSKMQKSILNKLRNKSSLRQSAHSSRAERTRRLNSKPILKDRVKQRPRGRTEETRKKVAPKQRDNSVNNDGYTIVDKIDLSGNVGRKLRHYYRKSGVKRRRVRTKYRSDVRATSFDVMDRIHREGRSNLNRTTLPPVSLMSEDRRSREERSFERKGDILVNSSLLKNLYDKGAPDTLRMSLDQEKINLN